MSFTSTERNPSLTVLIASAAVESARTAEPSLGRVMMSKSQRNEPSRKTARPERLGGCEKRLVV